MPCANGRTTFLDLLWNWTSDTRESWDGKLLDLIDSCHSAVMHDVHEMKKLLPTASRTVAQQSLTRLWGENRVFRPATVQCHGSGAMADAPSYGSPLAVAAGVSCGADPGRITLHRGALGEVPHADMPWSSDVLLKWEDPWLPGHQFDRSRTYGFRSSHEWNRCFASWQ